MSGILAIIIQSLVLIVFVNRYFAGWFFKRLRGTRFDETIDDYEPAITVVIPMFNEGAGIRRTIASLLEQDYPEDKLEICVVDDCSTDDSYRHAREAAKESPRVSVLKNAVNMGKRRSINQAVRASDREIIVSVDSDVVVERGAVRELVRRFTSEDIAAVGGRVDIRNKHDNWLTKMQTIKYYFGYSFLKNLERSFRLVMCLSGCLTAYRRRVLVELEPILENRNLLGVPIKYGEDRFLTRQIIKAGYKTTLTLDAVCRTEAPKTLSHYFSQQLRWRRSNIVDYIGGMSHVWRLQPVVAIHFFSLFGLLIAYPALIVGALAHGSFWPLMTIHLGVVTAFGVGYRWLVRRVPEHDKVSAICFLPIAFVMPVTYAVLTPVALFTLDSGRWETRGHEEPSSESQTLTDGDARTDGDDEELDVTAGVTALAKKEAARISEADVRAA